MMCMVVEDGRSQSFGRNNTSVDAMRKQQGSRRMSRDSGNQPTRVVYKFSKALREVVIDISRISWMLSRSLLIGALLFGT